MSNELLPCPFCGSEAEIVPEHVSWQVRCTGGTKCATWPVTNWRTRKEVIDLWNRRFVCLDKNGDKVFAGDKVRTAFRGTISLEPVMTVMFGGKPNRRMCFSGDIELIKEAP